MLYKSLFQTKACKSLHHNKFLRLLSSQFIVVYVAADQMRIDLHLFVALSYPPSPHNTAF